VVVVVLPVVDEVIEPPVVTVVPGTPVRCRCQPSSDRRGGESRDDDHCQQRCAFSC
jgi:hypothetical protein